MELLTVFLSYIGRVIKGMEFPHIELKINILFNYGKDRNQAEKSKKDLKCYNSLES